MPRVPVVTVNHEKGKAGGRSYNGVYLPVAENRVHRATPAAPELLALPERQLVGDAGGELVIQVERGKRPVQLLISRQREIGCSGERTQAVGHTRVKRTRVGVAQQGVEPLLDALRFSLDLERVVVCLTDVVVIGDRKWEQERRCSPLRSKGRATRTAT